jgi:glycosyltransferase involved in cell wall biosynthesis
MTSATPTVSVVMGVRNGEDCLEATLSSLTQGQNLDLEVIVVNDGSTDQTGILLERLADHDPRIRVLNREGSGLTLALIEGCHQARGTYIARQDAGDRSIPGRLEAQVACLEENQEAAFCSSYVRQVTPEGVTTRIHQVAEDKLADGLTGPAAHGSVMMRRDAYEKVGGYRPAFYYAQDIDLWSRLVECGRHKVLPEVLYVASLSPGSISGSRRREQEEFHDLIVGATRARRSGQPETHWLEQAELLSSSCRNSPRDTRREAKGAYFIAASLASEHPELSRRYLARTLELNPWHLKARLRQWNLR